MCIGGHNTAVLRCTMKCEDNAFTRCFCTKKDRAMQLPSTGVAHTWLTSLLFVQVKNFHACQAHSSMKRPSFKRETNRADSHQAALQVLSNGEAVPYSRYASMCTCIFTYAHDITISWHMPMWQCTCMNETHAISAMCKQHCVTFSTSRWSSRTDVCMVLCAHSTLRVVQHEGSRAPRVSPAKTQKPPVSVY